MLVNIGHAREVSYCWTHIKKYCDRYDLDMKEFVLRGLPEETLLAVGDAQIDRMVDYAKRTLPIKVGD